MAIQFGHTYVPNFSCIFDNQPNALTRHPYLNYLRQFKQEHPKSGFKRLLQEGAREWKRLKPSEKNAYAQKEVMKRIHKANGDTTRAYQKRSTLPSKFQLFPPSLERIPMAARRRFMSTSKNVKQSWRAVKYLARQNRSTRGKKARRITRVNQRSRLVKKSRQ